MRTRYNALAKLKLLRGDIYQVSEFVVWYVTLPFYLTFDLILICLKLGLYGVLTIYKSNNFQLFIRSSFASILVCSVFFTILIFAPISSLPLWLNIIVKVLLLFTLLIFSLNGLRTLDLKYQAIENDIENKMFHNMRKQINVGVPDTDPPAKQDGDPSNDIERLALQVRLAELEARQNALRIEAEYKQQELELKRQQLAIDKATVESPLYQLKKSVEARKVIVSDLETQIKEEDLGLRERDRDKDLTQEEKVIIGLDTEKPASKRLVKMIRTLERVIVKSGYQPKLFRLESNKVQARVIFSVNANHPVLPDGSDFIDSIRKEINSNDVKVRILTKAIEFIVMRHPYRGSDSPEEITPTLESSEE